LAGARHEQVGRAARDRRCPLIVGSILVVINHGDAIVHGDVDAGRLLRIALTMGVPYCVSTYSSVSALRDAARRQPGNHVA
jgi:hypothetical protein